VRLIGNLLGEAEAKVEIGAPVTGAFEHHAASAGPPARPAFTLLQWKRA